MIFVVLDSKWMCMETSHMWNIHDDVIKWKHFPRYWPFVRGIHRSPANSPHKGQWRGALMLSLICVGINGWINNREAGDLRRYRGHYDVIIIFFGYTNKKGRHSLTVDIFAWQAERSISICLLYNFFTFYLYLIFYAVKVERYYLASFKPVDTVHVLAQVIYIYIYICISRVFL